MPQKPVSVAILGAGLTGLSAAATSERLGVDYRLFERESQTGGLATTTVDADYRFDRTGHLLHLRSPSLRDELCASLGSELCLLQRESKVWSHGVYTDYPFQANANGLPPSVAYECVMGFVEAARNKPRTVTNFEEYCLAHFGPGISRHFMLPYNSRLWGVPAREITAQWCQRFVPIPSLEDVIAGAVGAERRALGYNTEFFYPALGIGQVASDLERRVTRLERGKAPLRIDLARKQLLFSDEVVLYDKLVSTIPLNRLLALAEPLPDEVQLAASRLRCTELYYLDLALTAPARQTWHWAYVPEARYPFYRVGCYSNFSDRLAPNGCSSLYVELVDRAPPDLAELLPRVFSSLMEMQVLRSTSDVKFARLRHIEHAYVIFDHAYYASTRRAHAFLNEYGVVSTGRYGEWTYSSMEDALLAGRRAVMATDATLDIEGDTRGHSS